MDTDAKPLRNETAESSPEPSDKAPKKSPAEKSSAEPLSEKSANHRSSHSRHGITRRRVNGRFLLLLVVVTVAAGVGVYFVHDRMVAGNVSQLRDRASAAADAGDTGKAVRLYSQYRQLQPNDAQAAIALAELIRRRSNTRDSWLRVTKLLEAALREDPTLREARRTLVTATLKTGQFVDANTHLDKLLASSEPNKVDPVLYALKGDALAGLNKDAVAGRFYIKAIIAGPQRVDPYLSLTTLLADQPDVIHELMTPASGELPVGQMTLASVLKDIQPGAKIAEIAPAIMQVMVNQAQPTWQARIERAKYYQRTGELSEALADVHTALRNSDVSGPALLDAAEIELAAAAAPFEGDTRTSAEHIAAARRIARRGIKAKLGTPRLSLILAQALMRSDQPEKATRLTEAITALNEGATLAKSLRETATGEDSSRLREAEIVLRWYLANYRLDAAMMDSVGHEKIEDRTRATIEVLHGLGTRRELTEFLAVRLEILNEEWAHAAQELESLRLRVMDIPQVRRRVDNMLALAYGHLQNPARQIELFRRVIAEDPLWRKARLGLAMALEKAGRYQEALENYAMLLDVPGVQARMARLLTIKTLGQSNSPQEIEKLQKLLVRKQGADVTNPAIALLRVELLIAQRKYGEAQKSLKSLVKEYPDSPEIWQAWVAFSAMRPDVPLSARAEQARKLLATGRQRFGDCVAMRLAEADTARLTDTENVAETISRMAQPSQDMSAPEQVRLLRGLTTIAKQAGAQQVERDLWKQLTELQPDSLAVWLHLAKFAAKGEGEGEVAKCLKQIRRIEGPYGPNGDFIAAYAKIVKAAADPQLKSDPERLKKFLDQPRELLEQAGQARSYWASVPWAQGILESLLGHREKAISYWEQAWKLGDRSTRLAKALIQHYQSTGQYARAEQIVAQLPPGQKSMPGSLAWRLRLQQGDLEGALKAARRQMEETGGLTERVAYASLLLLAYQSLPEDQIASEKASGILKKAEQILNAAVNTYPTEEAGWVEYIAFLKDLGRTDDAKQVIARASQAFEELPEVDRLLSLARCWATLGENKQAIAQFEQALQLAPKNVEARMEAASYFSVIGKLEAAKTQIDWLLDPAHKVPKNGVDWARRRAAFLLAASRGRHDDVMQAIAMLRDDAQSGKGSVADLRAQVALLSGQGTAKDRQMMIDILKKLARRVELTPAEQFHLAALYESSGQWPQSRKILEHLCAAEEDNANYLAAYLVGRLRHEPPSESARDELTSLLGKLKSLAPHSMNTALARAEFEKRFGTIRQAGDELTQFVSTFTQGVSRDGQTVSADERSDIASAAQAARELGAKESALALYRQFAEASPDAGDTVPLITYLGRLARYQEALDLLEKTASQLSPIAVAVTAVNIISLGTPSQKQIARAESFVDQALGKAPESSRIQAALGGLRAVQGRYEEAEKIYRAVLKKQPNNAAVLNNLAWLLMASGKDLDEAARLMDEAIAVAGPHSQLIDTRGTIDLARGNVEQALQDLQQAFAMQRDAQIGFHVAIALSQLGRDQEAAEMFHEVQQLGLDLNGLHPSEHAAFKKLAAQYGSL